MSSSLKLPMVHRQCLWSPIPNLITVPGFRTLKPGGSQFTLKPTQVRDWPNVTREIKELLGPCCGKYEAFVPVIPREVFGVANELGVQGRFVNNALHPVGEIANLLRLGVCFGDPQYGINRRQDEIKKGKKRKHGAQKTDGVKGKLVPDLVLVDGKTHAIRVLGEVKTFWPFTPKKHQTWHKFICDKLGQLARYMDDHYTRYGFFTIYEYTWFVKRIDDTHFAMSPPISTTAQSSANSVSLRECLLAIALRASDDRASYYGTRHGSKLTVRGYRPMRIDRRVRLKRAQ